MARKKKSAGAKPVAAKSASAVQMPGAQELGEVLDSRLFLAMAEPARVLLMKVLLERGRSDVSQLAALVPQDLSVISRHLRILHEAGVVRREKVQRHVFYEIDPLECKRRFREMTEKVERIIDACCPDP